MADPGEERAHLRRAVTALAEGDALAALHAASQACHDAPNDPEAHYAYGQAWLAYKVPPRAEQAFAAAIRLRPGWPDAWVNYGVARYQQGEMEDACRAMRHALRHAPDHPAAIANLAAFLRIMGDYAQSEALLGEALARNAANHGARLNHATALLMEGRSAEALAVLDAAAARPEDVRTARHWHLERARALFQLRRTDEARAALDAFAALGPCPPEFVPLWQWRRVLLADAERDEPRARQEAVQLAAVLANCGAEVTLEHRISGHFDLARFWSGRGEKALVFRHWTEGHRIAQRMQPFSRERAAAFTAANIACFDAARFATGPRAGNADPAPVFIVGMPRSGTTLCEQILAAHRDVHGAGERMALIRAFTALGGAADTAVAVERVAATGRAELDAAGERYLRDLHALAPGKARIVDKMPGNYEFLGLVGLLFPAARIIHCVRDPRDIGLSIFTFRFHGHHPYAHDLADIGWKIAQQARLMAHWKSVLPNPILTIELADWVHDFDATLARLLAHLDLPPDPDCARFHEREDRVLTASRLQVRQPVNARGLGRWRAFAGELRPLISELEAAGVLPQDHRPRAP
jgi:Flp pilus assembly protein TadD